MVYVTNTGSATETISLDTGPMPSWQVETVTTVNGTQRDVVQTVPHPEDDFTRHALPVPAAWVPSAIRPCCGSSPGTQ
jgi:hypothetical protein